MISLFLLLACNSEKNSTEETAIPQDTAMYDTGDMADSGDTANLEDTAVEDTTVEDSSEPTDTQEPEVSEECIDVPLITYSSFGQGFITFNCQGCHGSGAPDRQGAPESITFDNHEEVLGWLDRIYQRTYVSLDMPPALGIFDEDLERLRIWVECWDGE